MIVELSFMVIIIIGRWILPKGNISHSALSQLLLVYLALASDILDLLTLFGEQEIYNSLPMVHIVLIVFSLCMFQFAFNLTATRGRSFYAEYDEPEFEIYQAGGRHKTIAPQLLTSSTVRPLASPKMKPRATSFSIASPQVTVFTNKNTEEEIKPTSKPIFVAVDPPSTTFPRPSISSLHSLPSSVLKESRSKYASRKSIAESVKFFVRKRSAKLLRSELWSILVTVSLQDGPFFAVRLTAIFVYRVRSFLMYFFTFKNFLILLLQTYRIISICLEKDEQEQELEEKLSTIRRMSIAVSQFGIPLQRMFRD